MLLQFCFSNFLLHTLSSASTWSTSFFCFLEDSSLIFCLRFCTLPFSGRVHIILIGCNFVDYIMVAIPSIDLLILLETLRSIPLQKYISESYNFLFMIFFKGHISELYIIILSNAFQNLIGSSSLYISVRCCSLAGYFHSKLFIYIVLWLSVNLAVIFMYTCTLFSHC